MRRPALAPSHAVVFAGALPPPVTGMTAMTQVIVGRLQEEEGEEGRFLCLNWSRGKALRGWRWKGARAWGALRTLAALVVRGPRRSATFYYPASSSLGLYYDLVLVAAARLLGYRVALHHHCYSYLSRFDWRMALIVRLMGTNDAHVVHCEQMEGDFRSMYRSKSHFVFVPPTIVSQQLERLPRAARRSFTVGFLSNLTMTKGLDEAILTLERLLERKIPVRLILAGPCMGDAERQLVDRTLAAQGDAVEYRGAVYGMEKAQFFADIDALLFPTRYENESWGIVLTEALAVGKPVVARARGCVPWIVRGNCGLAVPPEEPFVPAASDLIADWVGDPARYESACTAALVRSAELEADATRQLPALVDFLRRSSRAA